VYKPKRHLSQNFLHNRQLVKKLVDKSSIGIKDTVIEVGPGKGIITLELAKRSNQVIAIEKDNQLVKVLLGLIPENVVLINLDALKYPLPESKYKVFSNFPFAVQGKLFRMFIQADNPPSEMCVIVRKRSALRWGGMGKSTQFSIIHAPWYQFSIIYRFKPNDFKPVTEVETVLFKIKQRNHPLVANEEKNSYKQFVKQGYGGGRRLKQNLSGYFSTNRLNKITQKLGISINAKPTEISLDEWIKLFKNL
jgi:23S rRNA (adenine-N6)-dimethyltransferase